MKTKIITTVILLIATVALGQGVQIHAHMVVEPGTSVHANTNLDVNTGELLLKPNATLIMGNGKTLTVNNGGAIKVMGNAANQATITSTGFFAFIVSDGGTISAHRATFEKMSGGGLTIQPGAVVDPTNTFIHCTFRQGSNGSTLLTINNSQNLTINGAVFISSPGMELHNVAKTLSQGIVNFMNYSGNFSGEDYENDNFNRIFWGATAPFDELATGIVGSGVELCFDALDVITVEDLLVQNGGIVNLVAGQRIVLLPGVLVQIGGKLHAWISTDGIFCNPLPLMAATEIVSVPESKLETVLENRTGIKAYPNPTNGRFTLVVPQHHEHANLIIEIYTLLGEKLFNAEFPSQPNYELDLTRHQPGMYIVRLIRGKEMDFVKVVRK